MTETELKLNRSSKLIGPKRTDPEDLSKEENCVINNCYPFRYYSRFCPRCRFYDICKEK